MSAIQPTRNEGSAALSRNDLEVLRQRQAKPGSPVLGNNILGSSMSDML